MENSITSKFVLAFVSVMIGIALLAQIASVGLTVTDITRGTEETIDVTSGLRNSSYMVNFTVHLIDNEPNTSIPSYGLELASQSGFAAYNATDGTPISAAFIAANFSLNTTDGSLIHTTRTSVWNDTDVNISVAFVSYYVNTSYQIIPTVVLEASSGWRADISECAAGTIIDSTYTNASGRVMVEGIDYTQNSTFIALLNSVAVNTTYMDSIIAYNDNCPDGYLTQGWQRNIINLVPGFFALALLGVGLWLFYSVAKDAGILN